MSHIYKHKKEIVTRIKRIQGQLNTVINRVEDESTDCFTTLQTLAASRGAINGLMNKLLQEHITEHIVDDPDNPQTESDQAAMELTRLLKTYWK